MNIRYTPRYLRAYDNLPGERKQAVIEAIQTFTDCIEHKKPLPDSLGLKPFRGSPSKYWEFRSTRADRILFNWEKGGIALRLVGSHDDLRRFSREN